MTDGLDGVRDHHRATGLTKRLPGPRPSPNLGAGPDFARLSADLGRNLMNDRLGVPSAVFEAA
ncbi:hypothetical protein NKI56_00925 [Mesorhizobium sp. M0622]|uniref:hypothetical protein n=1 Tax=unclassified Mesorhizobium TaxID=325217 RepID=UPI00333A7AD4